MSFSSSMPLRLPPGTPSVHERQLMPKWPSWFLLGWWLLVLEVVKLPGLGRVGVTGSAVQSGSLSRTVLVLTFGAAGALMLPEAARRLDRAGWRLLTFLVGYLGWALLTLTWSDSLQLTSRRLILAALLIVGAFGLGAGYYGRSERGRAVLARDILIAGVIAGVSAWVSAFSRGDVNVLSGDWALASASVAHQRYGYVLLLAAIVSVFGRHTSLVAAPFTSRRRLAAVLVGALVTIVSLRKRALLVVTLLATGFMSFAFRRRGERSVMLVRVGVGLSVVAIVVAMFGIDIGGTATPILTRGEQELDLESLGSLTGRVPLWEELIDRASERPWTGVGFGAFWTPERMADVRATVRWPAVAAHNGYLDEVLGTGLPGLVLLLGAWVTTIATLARRASKERDAFALLGAVWISSYLLLNLTESLMQNLFNFPFYSALVVAFAAFSSRSPINVSSPDLHQ